MLFMRSSYIRYSLWGPLSSGSLSLLPVFKLSCSHSTAPIVSGLSALSDRRSSSRRPTATDEATGRALRQLESPREHNRDREPQQREGGDQRSEVGGEKGLDFETGGGGGADGGDGGCSAVVSGSTGESKRRSSSTNRATDEREGHRRQDERFPQSPSAAGSLTGSVKESSHHDHAYRSASIRRQSESSMPALLDDARRHPYTTKGEDSRGGGGRWASPTNIAGDSARTRIRQAGEHVRSSVVNSDKYSRYSSTGRGIGVGRGGGGGGGGGGSLRNSWGSAASTMMMATSSGRLLGDRMRPLERSRGESLQRSLEEAMQVKEATRIKVPSPSPNPRTPEFTSQQFRRCIIVCSPCCFACFNRSVVNFLSAADKSWSIRLVLSSAIPEKMWSRLQ